jgi:hypothetical protein
MENGAAGRSARWKIAGNSLKKVNYSIPAIPFLGGHLRELKAYVHTDLNMNVHISIAHYSPK